MHNLQNIKKEVHEIEKSLRMYVDLYEAKCKRVEELEAKLKRVVNSKMRDLASLDRPPEWIKQYWEDSLLSSKLMNQINNVNFLLFRNGYPMIDPFDEYSIEKRVEDLIKMIEELKDGSSETV